MGVLKAILKFIGGVLVVMVVAFVVTITAARFADGPWGVIAGGAFSSGELVTVEPDWSFAKDLNTVEFQLLDPEASRTTWIMVHNGRVFIPSGYMNSTVGKLWKHWPAQAEADGRAILRIDGKLYNRQLQRVKNDPDLTAVLSEVSRKYIGGPVPMSEVESNNLWVFELLPR